MNQQGQPPKDRIKQPPAPPQFQQPTEQPTEGELTQDELNEWFVESIIRLQLGKYRQEAKEGKSPFQVPPMPQTQQPIRQPKEAQPYERMYGTTEAESPVVKKKPRDNKRMMWIIILIIAGGVAIYYAYQLLFGGYTLGW